MRSELSVAILGAMLAGSLSLEAIAAPIATPTPSPSPSGLPIGGVNVNVTEPGAQPADASHVEQPPIGK